MSHLGGQRAYRKDERPEQPLPPVVQALIEGHRVGQKDHVGRASSLAEVGDTLGWSPWGDAPCPLPQTGGEGLLQPWPSRERDVSRFHSAEGYIAAMRGEMLGPMSTDIDARVRQRFIEGMVQEVEERAPVLPSVVSGRIDRVIASGPCPIFPVTIGIGRAVPAGERQTGESDEDTPVWKLQG